MNIRYIHQRNSLQPEERLKLRKQIEMLFQKGEAFSFYPLRIIFRFTSEKEDFFTSTAPVRVGFSIPKKRFHRAHERNRIRRLLKEAWRLQKHALYEVMPPEKYQLHCFLVYNSREMLTFEEAKKAVEGVLLKLKRKAASLPQQNNHS